MLTSSVPFSTGHGVNTTSSIHTSISSIHTSIDRLYIHVRTKQSFSKDNIWHLHSLSIDESESYV